MKKIVSLLLCFCLLASAGCAKTKEEQPTKAGTDDEPVSQSAQLVFHLDELPSIGSYDPGKTARYFFEDGPRNVLEARDDYGGLIPYIAEYKSFHEPKVISYEDENGEIVYEERTEAYDYDNAFYGLMTEDGRIVTGGLWYGVEQYADPDGNVVYLFNRAEDKADKRFSWDYTDCFCLAAGDGSRVLSFEDETVYKLRDLPYFAAQTENEIRLYTMNGNLTVTLYPEKTDAAFDGLYFDILFADADRIVTKTDYYAEEEEIPAKITVWDWKGNRLSSCQTDIGLSHLGAELLEVWAEDGQYVYDCEGTLLDDKAYDFIYYGNAERQFLALSGENGTYEALYFDEDWTRVYPETGWPAQTTGFLNKYVLENKTVLCNYEEDVFYDFYGNPIPLPVPESEILEKHMEWDYSGSYELHNLYLTIFTSDAMLVCGADGTLLQRIEALPGLTSEEMRDAFREICCDAVMFLTDSRVYAVSIATGEVCSCALDDPETILAADPRAKEMDRYVDVFNGDMILMSQSLTGSDYYKWTQTAYGTSEGFPTIRNVRSFYQTNGFWSFATEDMLLTLSPEGAVLFKTRIDQSI